MEAQTYIKAKEYDAYHCKAFDSDESGAVLRAMEGPGSVIFSAGSSADSVLSCSKPASKQTKTAIH